MASKPTIKSAGDVARDWAPETQLVHGGTLRSQFGETSEALFLTQGFVYDSAEQAEARFKNEDPGYQYSRFANPTVAMFEERMRLLEGAEEARADGDRHGRRQRLAALLPQGRRSHRRRARHVRRLPLRRRDAVPALRHRLHADRRHATSTPGAQPCGPTPSMFFFETPSNPTLELVDIAAVCEDRQGGRRARRRRQRVRHAHAAAAARARRRRRRLFGDQAHRRPGPLSRRRGARQRGLRDEPSAGISAPDRPDAEPVQRLGDAEGPRDHAGARQGAIGDGCTHRRSSRRHSRASRACSTADAPIIRRRTSPSGR